MNKLIKQRIELVRCDKVPMGYKKIKADIIPLEWTSFRVGDLYTERKESGNTELPILSVSIHSGVSDGALDEKEIGKKVKRIEDKSQYKKAISGDLVFNMMRAWQGAIGVVRTDGMVSPAYIVAAPNSKIYPLFMNYYMKTPHMINTIHRQSYGVMDFRLRLYWDSFAPINCCIPCVAEQKKITKILTTCDKIIELKEKRITEKQKQKKYLLHQLLSGQKRLDGFNEKWKKVELGEVFTYIQPTKYIVTSAEYSNKYKTPVLTAGKTFILGYTNETDGIYNDLPVVLFDDFTTSSQYVDFPFKVKSSAAKILKCNRGFNSVFAFAVLHNLNYSIGGHERHWISKFAHMIVKMPELNEQTSIANILSTIDHEIELLQKDLKQEKLKKKALMQLLLTGIVRVNT